MNPLAPIAYCSDTGQILSVTGRRFDRNYVNVQEVFNPQFQGTILESKLIYLDVEYSDLIKYSSVAEFKHDNPHFFI